MFNLYLVILSLIFKTDYRIETKRKSKKECKLGSKNPMHNIKGKDNSKSNKSIIKVYKDDDIFIGTWYEFADKFQINRKFASAFFSGRKNSCYGWRKKEP